MKINTCDNRYGTLYGIGIGPGNEELLTLKAIRTIKKCHIIIAPTAKEGGESIAFNTAKNFISENSKVIIKHFPMGGKDRDKKLQDIYKTIEEYLKLGKNVGFLTLGDPMVYSTYIYLLEFIKKNKYKTITIPGITSFCAAASLIDETLVIGNEQLLIIPASKIDCIKDEKYVVIMKLYKCEEKVLDFLEKNNFHYVCVKRAYRQGQEILKTREEILNSRDYMSLIIAHRY